MKILLSSYAFHPKVGGIEAVSAMLSEEFVRQGHDLKVVTQTPANGTKPFPYEVIRRPSALHLGSLVRWSDVTLHVNISLQTGWPLLLGKTPWVISHHTWIPRDFRGALKRCCARRARNISVSHAVAELLGVPSEVIPSPYNHELFRDDSDDRRDRDLIFVGRLVSDKGVDCALTALGLLKEQRQLVPRLTIVGSGPEQDSLRRLAHEFHIADQVDFVGVKRDQELAEELRRHRILIVPSRWDEPFGIVALEGIASGCVVVGSSGGGLKDAIGPCGLTFPNGDAPALAASLGEILLDRDKLHAYRRPARSHLTGFTKAVVAHRYLAVMQSAMNCSDDRLPEPSDLVVVPRERS